MDCPWLLLFGEGPDFSRKEESGHELHTSFPPCSWWADELGLMDINTSTRRFLQDDKGNDMDTFL